MVAPGGPDGTPRDAVARLVLELFRHGTALAAGLAARTGLHPTDVNALRLLDAASVRPLSVNALGAELGLTSGSVTALVDRLETHGLVARRRDDSDRRRVLVTLTDAARQLGAEQLRPLARRLTAALDAADPGELATVERFLRVLLDQDVPERPPSCP